MGNIDVSSMGALLLARPEHKKGRTHLLPYDMMMMALIQTHWTTDPEAV